MNTNGNNKPSHLDKLLESKPPEFQAKVLRFALDSGMKENDPAFRLVQYVGYLAQLTESAPSEWKQIFESLYAELDSWTNLTTTQLKSYNLQAETVNNLAQGCDRLGVISEALKLTSQQQLEQLKILIAHLTDWKQDASKIPNLSKEITTLILSLESFQDQLLLETKKLTAIVNSIRQNQSSKTLIWNFDSWDLPISFGIVMFITALLTAVITVRILPPKEASLPEDMVKKIDKTHELVGYSYTKLQRLEEHFGTAPKQEQKPK